MTKSSTTSGQLDIWSALGSGWPVYLRVHLMPAAGVIWAPWVEIKVVAVKMLICYSHQFAIDCLHEYVPVNNIPSLVLKSMSSFGIVISLQLTIFMSTSSLQYTIFSCQEYIFSSVKLSQFLQYLPKYSLQSSSCFTTLKDQQSGLDIERWLTPLWEHLHAKDLLPRRVSI